MHVSVEQDIEWQPQPCCKTSPQRCINHNASYLQFCPRQWLVRWPRGTLKQHVNQRQIPMFHPWKSGVHIVSGHTIHVLGAKQRFKPPGFPVAGRTQAAFIFIPGHVFIFSIFMWFGLFNFWIARLCMCTLEIHGGASSRL